MTDMVCKRDGKDSVFGKNGLTGIRHRHGHAQDLQHDKSCKRSDLTHDMRLCGMAFGALSSRLLHLRTSLVGMHKHLRHKDTIALKFPNFIDS